jgi:SAM-dependent methyltransferase
MARLLVLLAILAGVVAAIVAAIRHRGAAMGRQVPGGILIDRPGVYDALTHMLLRSLFRRIAVHVAAGSPASARVLEVGCGPGHLSIMLADQGLEVTGLDLDPAMIERAEANAAKADGTSRPSFVAGDAAALPFPDASFDVAVSTFSVHHWAEPGKGLAEIGRVLRPGGRALIWDFKPGGGPHPFGPRHSEIPNPLEHVHGTPLRPVGATPWRWPWRFELAQRIELVRDMDADAGDADEAPEARHERSVR